MKKLGIIGAMNLEIELIKNSMDIRTEEIIAGFTYYSGKLNDLDVVLTCCGVGKVNAALCTQILIDKYSVDSLINTGIAGSMNKEVGICDVVISSDATYHDVRKNQMKSLFPFKEYFEGNKELIDLIEKACFELKEKGYKYHIGRIVTGDAFINDNILKEKIIEEYSPYCVEMEGGAIAHAAHINEIPFVILRSISDNANDDASIAYDEFEQIAANQAAGIMIKFSELLSEVNK